MKQVKCVYCIVGSFDENILKISIILNLYAMANLLNLTYEQPSKFSNLEKFSPPKLNVKICTITMKMLKCDTYLKLSNQ